MVLDYQIHRGYVPEDKCDYIVENYINHSKWSKNAHNIQKGSLYTEILEIFSPLIPYKFIENRIHITRYSPGKYLRDHLDGYSTLTTVCDISDGYIGGRLIFNKDTYVKLNKGDVLVFDGSQLMHGVEKVTEGTRLSLNIWTLPMEKTSKLL